jgi:hypothetical protein
MWPKNEPMQSAAKQLKTPTLINRRASFERVLRRSFVRASLPKQQSASMKAIYSAGKAILLSDACIFFFARTECERDALGELARGDESKKLRLLAVR